MFRPLFTASLIALCAPAWADTFTADARVDTVTIYPGVATVTRQITLDLPAGRHEIIVPGLPRNLPSEGLRLAAPDGVQIGAVNLAYDRLPVTPDQTSPDILAAKERIEELENLLRERNDSIAAIRLQVAAANEQIAFLQSLSKANTGDTITASSVADIQALAQMVGSEILRLRQDAFAAEQQAAAAERARQDDIDALEEARQHLEALMAPDTDGSVLTFTVQAAEAGEVTVDISALEGFANWSPVYDMRLTTGDAPRIDLERSVVVSQQSGKDWLGVKLVLSTARPGEQTAPSAVWAPVRRIISQEELEKDRKSDFALQGVMESRTLAAPVAEPMVMEDAAFGATANFSGATVTYSYPGTVDIRNGVEDLRLPLDTLELDADVWAEAAPGRDSIAYRMAEMTNSTQEVLLPGRALVFADGTMIGFSQMPLLAAGADTKIGFGPLDGLLLTKATPSKSEGDVGVFSSSNQMVEEAVITVRNVTGQNWRVLLRDAIPYSEQDDLDVSFEASPRVTRVAPDGQRGILEWDLDVPAGTTQELKLDYTLTWPGGYILQ